MMIITKSDVLMLQRAAKPVETCAFLLLQRSSKRHTSQMLIR